MKPSAYRSGRFLLWSAADEQQAAKAWPVDASRIREIRRPFPWFADLPHDYLFVADSTTDISCDGQALQRLLAVARDTRAGLIYSDYFDNSGDHLTGHPLLDCQPGSIRSDFNFGHFFIFSASAVRNALQKYGAGPADPDAALYDLRLKVSIDHPLFHVPEFLYTVSPQKRKPEKSPDRRTETQFAYVARENFARQKKLEKVATNYLKLIGAHLPPRTKTTIPEEEGSLWKASVVIPVLNRKKTIADALASALEQKTDFPFNILVVDNHSTDGTTALLKKFAAKYPHIHHIIPTRRDLGIGGCWNEAIHSPHCGRYAVQLDSDDLYSSPHTLQKTIRALCRGRYAMLAGSYTLVNEKLKPTPPGLIDHKEWTPANGHNNLLRVNGLGAPRAFAAAVVRQFGFPDVS
ncbi:MAG TPA: glycosyltransferase family 2 protein, partial [Smithellaceae bacterium]|nr:glycosyltransferase family 2 protein [Smithellaceae bacterium]